MFNVICYVSLVEISRTAGQASGLSPPRANMVETAPKARRRGKSEMIIACVRDWNYPILRFAFEEAKSPGLILLVFSRLSIVSIEETRNILSKFSIPPTKNMDPKNDKAGMAEHDEIVGNVSSNVPAAHLDLDEETAAYTGHDSGIQVDDKTNKELFWTVNKRILACMLGVRTLPSWIWYILNFNRPTFVKVLIKVSVVWWSLCIPNKVFQVHSDLPRLWAFGKTLTLLVKVITGLVQ